MTETNNPGTGIIGVRIDPATGAPMVMEEHEHFHVCPACGQAVDRRDLGQVLHHEEAEHQRLSLDA